MLPAGGATFYEAISRPSIRSVEIMSADPKTHARFLSYRERHAYFGRGELAKAITFSEYAALDAERLLLLAIPPGERTRQQAARLAEVLRLMLED